MGAVVVQSAQSWDGNGVSGNQRPVSLPIPLPLSTESFERLAWLHHQLAPSQSAYELVWTHCQIVARLARDFAQQYRANMTRRSSLGTADSAENPWGDAFPDADLAYVGGLVHDIGVYRVFSEDGMSFERGRYIFHGIEGYRILIEEGYGEALAQFARNHTGVGITRADIERQHLPLPPADYTPRTIEQEIVMYADKFHTKSHPPTFVSLPAARKSAARFGEGNAERFDALTHRYGVPRLRSLADEYQMAIR
jgi:uncharacterized protein